MSDIKAKYASKQLPPTFAKLYSQYTKLSANQPGLTYWQLTEGIDRFNDAIRILEAAFIEKEVGGDSWQISMRRAAELLEWLSHPQLKPDQINTLLLSAALYQMSGYPARATGILNENLIYDASNNSLLLKLLLEADFKKLFKTLSKNWSLTNDNNQYFTIPWEAPDSVTEKLSELIFNELVGILGIVCSSMRWGNEDRLNLASEKMLLITKILLRGENYYSWLLAKLSYEVVLKYTESTLRNHLTTIIRQVSDGGKSALERYIRQNYNTNRNLAWPSQVKGIRRLTTENSFALCTPTGSGKTTIAELAIIQSLFQNENQLIERENPSYAPLAIYIVPSRALASEIEGRLSRVLQSVETEPTIVVTGLYGGTDWGPSEAWITSNEKTVLICTYEKAEALLRFLGPLFIHRIKLLIIDEAHTIQFDGQRSNLQSGGDRHLRLENLCMRLLTYIDQNNGKAIALSAVSVGGEQALANWVTGSSSFTPEETFYRSTRQLIGRLECKPFESFEINYDLLDGSRLAFKEGGENNGPYILNPFPRYPPLKKPQNFVGVEKRIRPYLFWAAMNLAASDRLGNRHTVLISVTQRIIGYASDLLDLLQNDWSEIQLPAFFTVPNDESQRDLWEKCLASCKDYFTENSYEYQLLTRGIVLHHGKLPGQMARLLIKAVREKVVHLVIATSTLSEGINLPVETILIPSLKRGIRTMDVQEFGNLVGRAGRPGVGTEGKTLVLLSYKDLPSDKDKERRSLLIARNTYLDLISKMQNKSSKQKNNDENILSPLAELIEHLEQCWRLLTGSVSEEAFIEWLETTVPTEIEEAELVGNLKQRDAIETLDMLDNILLTAIVEIEQLSDETISEIELEKKLSNIWKRSFAFYVSKQEKRLERFFVKRGQALRGLLPDPSLRKMLYCTNLQPRVASSLLLESPKIIDHLASGKNYSKWDQLTRFEYIRKLVELVSRISAFNLEKTSNAYSWSDILSWWLRSNKSKKLPDRKSISDWFDFVSKNFQYKFNWGLGSVIGLVVNDYHKGVLRETKLEEWPNTKLPWVVLWIKDLIVWGTLDPVAAYLLSYNMETTREEAEKSAAIYYIDNNLENPDELLDPRKIRDWALRSLTSKKTVIPVKPPTGIQVNLVRNFSNSKKSFWRVLPVQKEGKIYWFDPAGFLLATSNIPEMWQDDFFDSHDFILESDRKVIISSSFI